MSFKVGQRVRCIKNPKGEDMVGWEGVVLNVGSGLCFPVQVDFDMDDDWLPWPMLPEELEVVK